MDRTLWLSLMVLGLGIAVLLTGRAVMDGTTYLRGVSLAAEIQRLDGAPSSQDLADRTTEAAGCIYGNRSPGFAMRKRAHPTSTVTEEIITFHVLRSTHPVVRIPFLW